jgi:O-glycosyl hydrolase
MRPSRGARGLLRNPATLLAVLASALNPANTRAQATITVDSTTRFQTVSGWECVTFASQGDPAFPNYKDELFDRVINEAGINRLRLEVRSGAENSTDYFAQYQSGQVDYATWRANRYATVNDNADPNVMDPQGFHFTELDQTIQMIVLPLRARAAAKGEPLYINLNYVAFTGQITQGGGYHHANAAEYAEFILAVFQHMERQFGFVPDAVEILLEPDNVSQWNGTTVGNAIAAVAARLAAAGYSPEIIAPSCTNMGNAVSYFDALAAVPGALSALDEICYHRYGGVSDANLQALASRAQQHGKRTSMLEWWSTGNSIDILFKDLTMGQNGAWQQGVLGGIGDVDNEMALYKVDVTNPSAPIVRVNQKTRLLRQVYRFVRRGAVRTAATSSSGTFQPVAFINADGGQVVAVRATAAGAFAIHGLSAGSYGINYSTASDFNVSLASQTIATNGVITTSIPANGALTVYSLRPRVSAAIFSGDTFHFTIRSLKPGFTGAIERNADLVNPNGWLEVDVTTPGDFLWSWSGPINPAPAFFRFRQMY